MVKYVIILLLGIGFVYASAENFGIRLDNTCVAYLKANITTDCPTYEDIITLFPDTSNRKISGDFGYYNGLYQRAPTKLHHSYEYYRSVSGSVMFVDPQFEDTKQLRIIEIRANLKEYLLPDNKSYDAGSHSLTFGYGRFVDSCRLAYVDAGQWSYLVGDTLNYFAHNCSEDSTKFNSTRVQKLYKISHDISTSYKWKLEQWQKKSIEECGKKICIYLANQTAPP